MNRLPPISLNDIYCIVEWYIFSPMCHECITTEITAAIENNNGRELSLIFLAVDMGYMLNKITPEEYIDLCSDLEIATINSMGPDSD
jgi:hypothetical protein